MKAFTFRLAGLLHVRRMQREAAEARLEQLRAELRRLEHWLATLWEEDRAARAALAARLTVRREDLDAVASFQTHVASMSVTLNRQMEETRTRIAAQTQEVTRRRRDEKLLEELEHNERRAWDYEANRETETLAADAYLAALVRNQSEPN